MREQRWASLSFDRLRIMHRFGSRMNPIEMAHRERLLHLGLLWGLRQMGLRQFLESGLGTPEVIRAVSQSLKSSRDSFQSPKVVAQEIKQTVLKLESSIEMSRGIAKRETIRVLSELREMSFLLQTDEVMA